MPARQRRTDAHRLVKGVQTYWFESIPADAPRVTCGRSLRAMARIEHAKGAESLIIQAREQALTFELRPQTGTHQVHQLIGPIDESISTLPDPADSVALEALEEPASCRLIPVRMDCGAHRRLLVGEAGGAAPTPRRPGLPAPPGPLPSTFLCQSPSSALPRSRRSESPVQARVGHSNARPGSHPDPVHGAPAARWPRWWRCSSASSADGSQAPPL